MNGVKILVFVYELFSLILTLLLQKFDLLFTLRSNLLSVFLKLLLQRLKLAFELLWVLRENLHLLRLDHRERLVTHLHCLLLKLFLPLIFVFFSHNVILLLYSFDLILTTSDNSLYFWLNTFQSVLHNLHLLFLLPFRSVLLFLLQP